MKSRLFGAVIAYVALVSLSITPTERGHAATVGIVGYDVLSADISGTGNWFHTYTGLITPLSGTRANYTGGTGTMADGVSTGTTAANTQLFYAPNDQIITLYLDGFYTINQMEFYGGDHGATTNGLPGSINGMDITFNGSTETYVTTQFGLQNISSPWLINDRVTITGSGLDGLVTDTIKISLITYDIDRFPIAEIVIDGQVAVPIPPALYLFGTGLIGLVGMARRKAA
ncbi:VPLPA-CTERM sorting domain-containing protein [Pseudomonadota bacterium]